MQVTISFEPADLVDFYQSKGVVPPAEVLARDKPAWLQANVLEPFLEDCLLQAINQYKQNKAIDTAQQQASADQAAIIAKIRAAREARRAQLAANRVP